MSKNLPKKHTIHWHILNRLNSRLFYRLNLYSVLMFQVFTWNEYFKLNENRLDNEATIEALMFKTIIYHIVIILLAYRVYFYVAPSENHWYLRYLDLDKRGDPIKK